MAALGHRRAIAGRRPRERPSALDHWTSGSIARDSTRGLADRKHWERARWGHLVDHLLFDWLECREDSVEEAMQLLGELDTGERFFAPLLAAGRAWWSPPPTSVPCTPA